MKRSWIAVALAVGAIASPARSQNLLVNPDFDDADQLSGWAETGGKTWSSDDFAGDPSSGSVQIPNSFAPAGSVLMRQCVPATAGQSLHASAEVRVAPGQSAGSVFFALAFWDTVDCSGTESNAVGFFPGPAAPITGDWSPVASTIVAPALTQGAEIELTVVKGAGGSLTAFFDHVFLPEPDAALAPVAALAALCALGRWRVAQG